MEEILDQLFLSWQRSSHLHTLQQGATEAEISEFERAAGWALPVAWRKFYGFTNGAYLLGGNVNFYPLLGDDFSVINASAGYRFWNWPIPDKLWLVGDDGQGDPYGIWVGERNNVHNPIVKLGAIFEPGCMAIAASSLEKFLLARTAFYINYGEASQEAANAIRLPAELFTDDVNVDLWDPIGKWADPDRPGASDGPYEERLDSSDIERLLGIGG